MHKNASDIFCLNAVDNAKDGSDQIFSVAGSPSIRLNRRRDQSSSVYPYGPASSDPRGYIQPEMNCPPSMPVSMPGMPMNIAPNIPLDMPMNMQMPMSSMQDKPPTEETPIILSGQPDHLNGLETMPPPIPVIRNLITRRNPLTGEGIELDIPRGGKRGIRGRKSMWTW